MNALVHGQRARTTDWEPTYTHPSHDDAVNARHEVGDEQWADLPVLRQ
jgi:hypothetical protein